MADFASTNEDGVPVWINLDYVYKINRGLDPREPTSVYFINGESLSLSRSDGSLLVEQLNLCCIPRPVPVKPPPSRKPVRGRRVKKRSTTSRA